MVKINNKYNSFKKANSFIIIAKFIKYKFNTSNIAKLI